MANPTRPTADQINFRSSQTGDSQLDAYLEAAEKGGRSLADLVSDLWGEDGNLDQDTLELRINSSTNQLEARLGDHGSESTPWTPIYNAYWFNYRGLHADATEYFSGDLIRHPSTGVTYVCHTRHTSIAAIPDDTKFLEATINAEGGGGGGVEDHGLLLGLLDDDHAQYHTDARGDARYYLKAAVDAALAAKADSTHSHDADYDPLGEAAAEVATHEAAQDPHPQYTTVAEAQAAAPVQEAPNDGSEYVRKNEAWAVATGGGGGSSDHGELAGLTDDDHAQYHNDARGDARYATGGSQDSHSARTDNPHAVTAGQVGADPAGTASAAVAVHVAAGDPHTQYKKAGDGITDLSSGAATDGQVPTADGAGNIVWEDAPGLDLGAEAGLPLQRYSELLVTVASSGSAQAPVIDGRHYKITLSATCTITLTAPTGAASGVVYSSTIDLVMDGSSTYSWAGGTINEMGTQTDNTTSGAVNSYVVKTYDAGTTWFVYPAGAEV